MNIKTTPDQHLAMMQSIEAVLRHFQEQDNMTMYKDVVAIREYLQGLADDYAMMRVVIDRLAVNNLAAHDNR
jgi:hypothetical protein